MKDRLIDRPRGQYQVGQNNEFGTRSFADFIPPISLEAANRIEELERLLYEAGMELESWNAQTADEDTRLLTVEIQGNRVRSCGETGSGLAITHLRFFNGSTNR